MIQHDAILACEGSSSQHGELLADRWLKHESAVKSVQAQGLSLFMLAHGKQEMCAWALSARGDVHLHVCIHDQPLFCTAFNICGSVVRHARVRGKTRSPLSVHVWTSLGVSWAQTQQNATGMRISAASPWQQRNARADRSSRIEAQRSSQRGKRNGGPY